ncbi:MAG: M48 family metallopeptidase [Planctomycetes bacterium]|nr:M48 family metallopeptidase [Planctomycetota bacterium]
MMRPLRLVLASALLLLTGACANLNLFSDSELNALGVQAYAEATKEYPVVTSGPNYEMVQRVGRKIAAASQEPFEWEFKLLHADDIPNAFCLPGGKVAIYSGILPLALNEDGLAAVMGHEVAHAIRRHGGKRMTQNAMFELVLTAANAGLSMTEMDEETKALTMSALGVGGKVGILKYSRDHESEADVIGLRYAIRSGYDPNAAPLLWERMAQLSGDRGTPEWLSTHPTSLRRAAELRSMIPTLIAEDPSWDPKSVNK